MDGARVMELIRAQCSLGPRVPGTPAHEAGRQWIVGQMKALGLVVREEPFEARLALTGATVKGCRNLWGLPVADGPTSPAMILSAHWDTRPYADQDPSGRKPAMLGADDGASGVALALELLRELRASPMRAHLALAFWDAEDGGVNDQSDSWGLGARHAAEHPPAWVGRVAFGLNLDMVGGEGSHFRPETYSQHAAPWAVRQIWTIGRSLAPEFFEREGAQTMIDDHLPWIQRGIPFVDLIGWPFEYWHTAGDGPEHCDPKMLEAVGDVVHNFLLGEPWARAGAK